MPIVSVQNEYNFIERKYDAVIDYCEANAIIFIPWYPLLKGKFKNINQVLKDLTEKYKCTMPQLALAWLLKRSPIMLPIPGTLSIAHVEENMAALKINLSEEDFRIMSTQQIITI